MSSYGSTSPSDEGFDRYEPPFYCQPSHQGSPMDGGVYWPGATESHEFDAQDIYNDASNYIGRNYAYEEMQVLGNEPYDAYHSNMMHHNYNQNNGGLDCDMQAIPRYDRPAPSFVRVVKRRTTANKKERRRTQSINTAFTDLRECIPNVPPDTKLSKMVRPRSQSINIAFSRLRDRIPSVLPDTKMTKIKTLRLATSYISYLLKVLESDEPAGGFRAELHHAPPRRRTDIQDGAEALETFPREMFKWTNAADKESKMLREVSVTLNYMCERVTPFHVDRVAEKTRWPQREAVNTLFTFKEQNEKKGKGRTGWPQHVWALELKSESNLQT